MICLLCMCADGRLRWEMDDDLLGSTKIIIAVRCFNVHDIDILFVHHPLFPLSRVTTYDTDQSISHHITKKSTITTTVQCRWINFSFSFSFLIFSSGLQIEFKCERDEKKSFRAQFERRSDQVAILLKLYCFFSVVLWHFYCIRVLIGIFLLFSFFNFLHCAFLIILVLF